MTPAPITIATLTYEANFVDMRSFFVELKPALENYPGPCELIVINNSGDIAAKETARELSESGIEEVCTARVLSSPKNNIATARNLALEQASHDLFVFMDDDGFPVPEWLNLLTSALQHYETDMVAGPTLPLYLFDAPKWVKTVDLHNANNRRTGQLIDKSTAGNLLLMRSRLVGDYFSETYGESGGEDSEFLLRQKQAGLRLTWCNEAAVYEYIPEHKSSGKYFIKRFIAQGQLHRKILTELGTINLPIFISKSVLMIMASAVIAPILLVTSSRFAGRWVKRGFGNLGHLGNFTSRLYPSTDRD